ncbi:MAG: ATP-binding cassette domain-containing protein [Candidatus Dormibacteraeota bacterium]|nr:ATP-binding cassette domain-containing protein [Candidatus Dormibacteraeota bacterium]
MTLQGEPEQVVIAADGVSFAYGKVVALREVSFRLVRGDLAYLVGPSAAGKTTLLRLIHGLMRPGGGRLVVNGLDVHIATQTQLRRLRREVGVVFQDYKLLERLTAEENVTYALRLADLTLAPREAGARAAAALRQVGLGERLSAYPRELSGGQQQRLGIARALASKPVALLADEPTASLDEANARNVMELLQHIAGDGTTVLVATHDTGPVREWGGRMLTLEQGVLKGDRQLRPSLPLRARSRIAWVGA